MSSWQSRLADERRWSDLIGEDLVAPAVDGPGEPGELGDVGVGGVPEEHDRPALRVGRDRPLDHLGKEFTGEPDRGDFAIWVRRVGFACWNVCSSTPSALDPVEAVVGFDQLVTELDDGVNGRRPSPPRTPPGGLGDRIEVLADAAGDLTTRPPGQHRPARRCARSGPTTPASTLRLAAPRSLHPHQHDRHAGDRQIANHDVADRPDHVACQDVAPPSLHPPKLVVDRGWIWGEWRRSRRRERRCTTRGAQSAATVAIVGSLASGAEKGK